MLDDNDNNISENYTFEAIMFCLESNLHGQNFLNACLIRIEKMGEKIFPVEKNVINKEEETKKKEEEKEKENTSDYFLTEEGDYFFCIFLIFFCFHYILISSFFPFIYMLI